MDIEELRYLRQELGFAWNETASLLGVSAKTLQRRAMLWGIKKYTEISDHSDVSLNEKVGEILVRFPNSGEVMINGHLKARNVWVILLKLHYRIASHIFCNYNSTSHGNIHPSIGQEV